MSLAIHASWSWIWFGVAVSGFSTPSSPVSTTLCSVLDFLFFCVGPQNLPAFQLSGFGFLAFFKLTQMSRISETLTYERLSSFGSVRFRSYQRKIHASLLSLIWWNKNNGFCNSDQSFYMIDVNIMSTWVINNC
jgi:hypothetical protein